MPRHLPSRRGLSGHLPSERSACLPDAECQGKCRPDDACHGIRLRVVEKQKKKKKSFTTGRASASRRNPCTRGLQKVVKCAPLGYMNTAHQPARVQSPHRSVNPTTHEYSFLSQQLIPEDHSAVPQPSLAKEPWQIRFRSQLEWLESSAWPRSFISTDASFGENAKTARRNSKRWSSKSTVSKAFSKHFNCLSKTPLRKIFV